MVVNHILAKRSFEFQIRFKVRQIFRTRQRVAATIIIIVVVTFKIIKE